jgi:bis(5'-nucleosyl)-tetraphosphatase (symmetrical)
MASYAVGDVQGCMSTLERLLGKLPLGPGDRLWLVGDLVNRGPRSLDVLRWARALGERAVIVLGNHDLHLIARAAGTGKAKKRDTLDDVLGAPDLGALIDWLRARPLAHVEAGRVMVHAGLHPQWSAARTRALAGEIEARLRGPDWRAWTTVLDGGEAPAWRDELEGAARTKAILSWLVRARMVKADGTLDQDFNGGPGDAPKHERPWFAAPHAAWADHEVVFGHWAAAGFIQGPTYLGLDSGCVWGKQLTAVRLDDRAVFQVDAVDA